MLRCTLCNTIECQLLLSQAKRRKAVQWPDEATHATEESSQQLEKVIGYSDGGEFASRVGPQPIESSDGSGRFADLVQSRIVSKKDKERQQLEQGQDGEAAGMICLHPTPETQH